MLFLAFESWIVSEHRKLGFPEELLSSTFAISSWGNGAVAIIAGVVAQVVVDAAGDIDSFQLAIAILTFVTLVLILCSRENYGHCDDKSVKEGEGGGVLLSGHPSGRARQSS